MRSILKRKGIVMQLNSTIHEIERPGYWARHLNDKTIVLGALQLSPSSNRVKVGEVQVFLRPMEFSLLHFFMTNPDRVHSRERLLKEIWGDWVVVGARTVDVHIRRIRATLEPFGLDAALQTVHCRGYIFTNASQAAAPVASIN
jgi:two-component system phosphate regulon response regulator PhoB